MTLALNPKLIACETPEEIVKYTETPEGQRTLNYFLDLFREKLDGQVPPTAWYEKNYRNQFFDVIGNDDMPEENQQVVQKLRDIFEINDNTFDKKPEERDGVEGLPKMIPLQDYILPKDEWKKDGKFYFFEQSLIRKIELMYKQADEILYCGEADIILQKGVKVGNDDMTYALNIGGSDYNSDTDQNESILSIGLSIQTLKKGATKFVLRLNPKNSEVLNVEKNNGGTIQEIFDAFPDKEWSIKDKTQNADFPPEAFRKLEEYFRKYNIQLDTSTFDIKLSNKE